MRSLIALLLATTALQAQPPKDDLARKPPYERLLKGDDLKKAVALQKQAEEAAAKDDYGTAIKHAEELLALRESLQGADHWEALDQKQEIVVLVKLKSSVAGDREGFRASLQDFSKAADLHRKGDYRSALPLLQSRMKWCLKVLGEEHTDSAASCNNVAYNLERQGKAAEAASLYKRSLEVRCRVLGEEHPDTATSYNNVACNLERQGKAVDAGPFHQKALEIRRKVLGEEHPDIANSYNNFAMNLDFQGKAVEAGPLHQKALETIRKIYGEEHPHTALSYNNVALNLNAQGKYAESGLLHHKALAIYRKIRGEEHPDTATVYNNIAANFGVQGLAAEAGPFYERALAIRRKTQGEEHPDTADSYNNIASNLAAQGKYSEAGALYQKALEIRRKVLGEEHPDTANSYNNVAVNLDDQGFAAEAGPFQEKALAIYRKVLGEVHPETAIGYRNLASNFVALGKYAEAGTHYQKALEIQQKVLGEEHPDTAASYHDLALMLVTQGNAVEAEYVYKQSLNIRLKVLGEEHPDTNISLKNLAWNLHSQGKTTAACKHLERAVRSYEASRLTSAKGLDRASLTAFNPRELLAVLVHDKEPQAAWFHMEMTLARGTLDEQAGRTEIVLTVDETAEQTSARAELQDAQSQILVLVSKRERTQAESDALEQLLAKRRTASERLSKLAVSLSTRNVASAEAIRAALPADAALLLWIDVADNSGQVQEHWACIVRSTGEPRWVKLPGSGEQMQWTKADGNLPNQLREALRSKVPPAQHDALIQKLQAQRIAPVLPHLDGVKTLYVVGVDQMAGIPVEVLAPQFTVSYIPSGTYLARLKDRPAPSGHRLLALGDPIFKTLKEEIATPKRPPPTSGIYVTTVVSGGAAAQAKLLVGDVILKYGTTELKNLEDLKTAVAANAAAKEVLIVVWRETADKDLERTVPPGKLGVALDPGSASDAVASRRRTEQMLASLRGGNWGELPGTKVEVTGLAKLMPDAKVFVNGDASEANLEALRKAGDLGKYRYLHFATHGEGNNVKAFESMLILAQNNLPKELMPKPGEPFHDGKLSAREVLDHWKLNADLVTLSACETAIGKNGGGDGLLGFAQAFLLAGSRSVCLSLWKVDDCATALLMQRFYENLITRKMGKAAALHEAKAWLRNLSADDAVKLAANISNGVARGDRGPTKDFKPAPEAKLELKLPGKDAKPFADPRYWAAFILIGDPN